MKKILNNAPPVSVSTLRSPLTVNLSVRAVSGRLTQAQDAMKALWQPDRQLSALILEPTLAAYNPDTGSAASVTPAIAWYRRTYSADGSTAPADTLITSTTVSGDYYKETVNGVETGRLVVRKNVDYLTPEFVVCKATYTDNVSSGSYTVEYEVKLTAANLPDEFYAVKIQDSAAVIYRPLTDTVSTRQLTAKASLGNSRLAPDTVKDRAIGVADLGSLTWSYSGGVFTASLPSSPKTSGGAATAGYTQDQSLGANKTISTSAGNIRVKDSAYTGAAAFKAAMHGHILFYELATKTVDKTFAEAMRQMVVYYWYLNDVLMTADGTMPGYVGGQGTGTITVDLDCLAGAAVTVRLGVPDITENNGAYTVSVPASPNVPARDGILTEWEWGHVDALPIGRGGSKIRQTEKEKTFDAVVRCDNKDVDAAKVAEYLRLNWKTHATSANYSTTAAHGWGTTAVIPGSTLRQTGDTACEVYADIYTLGPVELLEDDSSGTASGYVTDDGGTLLTGRV